MLDRLPPSTQGHHWPHGITIVTPERRFLLACETESEQRAWLDAFRKVVDRPMLPQEYAGKGWRGWSGDSECPCGRAEGGRLSLLQSKPTSSTNPDLETCLEARGGGGTVGACAQRERLLAPGLMVALDTARWGLSLATGTFSLAPHCGPAWPGL